MLGGRQPGLVQALLQMEAVVLIPYMLGLLLLPLLAVVLCVRCRELPGECGLPGNTALRTCLRGSSALLDPLALSYLCPACVRPESPALPPSPLATPLPASLTSLPQALMTAPPLIGELSMGPVWLPHYPV